MDIVNLNSGNFFLPNNHFYTQTFGAVQGEYHSHAFFEVFYIISGQAEHNLNGRVETVKKGDLLFLKPGDCHQFILTNEKYFLHRDILFDKFYFEKAEKFLETDAGSQFLAKGGRKLQLSDFQISHLEERLKRINAATRDAEKNALILSLISSLVSLLVEAEFGESPERPMPVWLEQLISLLNINSSFHLTKAKILHLLNTLSYSKAYVSRAFKRYTGKTMSEYINDLRFSSAYVLLTSTDLGIDQIIEYVGLTSKAYFYREFKARYATTPKKLRLNRKSSGSPDDAVD